MFRGVLSEHCQDIGSAASAAVARGRGRAIGDLTEGPCAFANGPFNGPIFNVVAPAHGLQTADYRMLGVVAVHNGEGNTLNQEPLPRFVGRETCGFGRGVLLGTPRESAEESDLSLGFSIFGFRIAESYPFP